MCVACRSTVPAAGLVRFARHPDGVVGVDVRARLPGRGAWTCPTRSCVSRAIEKGGLARAFEAAIVVDCDSLCAEVERVLSDEALRGLSIARRMGRLWPGRTEALDAAKKRANNVVVILAEDLAERSQDDVKAVLSADQTVAVGGTKVEMGAAIGRRATGVLALAKGPQSDAVISDLARLSRFRASSKMPVKPDGGVPKSTNQSAHPAAPAPAEAASDVSAKSAQTTAPSGAGEVSSRPQPKIDGRMFGQPKKKRLSQGGRELRALRDVAPKRTSAADETPLGPEATLRRGRDLNERPCKRAVG